VLPQKDLIPHVPLLLLFAASAQTHIFPEIRIDAIRFLDLLLDAVPESVVCGWNESGLGHGKRVLEGYLGILSAGIKFGGGEGLSTRIDNIFIRLIAPCSRSGTAQATSTTSVVLSPQVPAFVQCFHATQSQTLLVKTGSLEIPFFLSQSCNRLAVFCIRRITQRGWPSDSTSTNLVFTTFFRDYSVIRRTCKRAPALTPWGKWQASNLEYDPRVRVFR
jgi:hypothetical protein